MEGDGGGAEGHDDMVDDVQSTPTAKTTVPGTISPGMTSPDQRTKDAMMRQHGFIFQNNRKQNFETTLITPAADHVDSMNTPRETAKREVHKIEHDLDPNQSRIMFHFQDHATIDLEELCNNVQEITGEPPVAAVTTYRRGAMVTVERTHRAKALTAHNTYTKNNIEYRKVLEPEHTSADLDRAKARLRKIDMEAQADQDLKAASTDIDYSKLMLDEETVTLLKQATKLKANAIYDTERDRIKQSVEALVQPKLATENMKRYLEEENERQRKKAKAENTRASEE